jgi:hypothetical protein
VVAGLVIPLVGAGLAHLAAESFMGEGQMVNIIPVVLGTATAALLGPLVLLLVVAFCRPRGSLTLLATACLAAALTWVVVVLIEVGLLIISTWWLSSAVESSTH